MSICIYGGSFDPVHKGHLYIADKILSSYNFDQFIFMVSKEPPHKKMHSASFIDRYNMVKIAVQELDYSSIIVSDIENHLHGKSYSYNTLLYLKEKYPKEKLYFLTGSDMFAQINTWYCWKKLFSLCSFIVGHRPGINLEQMITALPLEVKDILINGNGVEFCEMDSYNISSSDIRENIMKYKDFIPQAVFKYIEENKIYRTV